MDLSRVSSRFGSRHAKSGKNMARNMTICSVDPSGGSQRAFAPVSSRIEGPSMTQPMIATLIAVAVVAIAFLAVLGLMRPKRITLVDYPELPAPPKDEKAAAGPTMQA